MLPLLSGRSKNMWRVFRHSRFYVSVMLICVYIVFTILPDLLWTFNVVNKGIVRFILTIMYSTSHLADGIIYILIHDRVKKTLYKKLSTITCCAVHLKSFLLERSIEGSKDGSEPKCLNIEGKRNKERLRVSFRDDKTSLKSEQSYLLYGEQSYILVEQSYLRVDRSCGKNNYCRHNSTTSCGKNNYCRHDSTTSSIISSSSCDDISRDTLC